MISRLIDRQQHEVIWISCRRNYKYDRIDRDRSKDANSCCHKVYVKPCVGYFSCATSR